MTTLYIPELQVNELKQKYNLEAFIETGCYRGESLAYINDLNFRKLYSCDLNESCVNNCKKIFPEATILHMESLSFLKQILPTVESNTLFWLDAHFPSFYQLEETVETKFPLVEELKLIKQYKPNFHNDVILCDDVRILLPENNPAYNHGMWEQFNVHCTVNELTSVLQDTHDYTINTSGEGVLVFTPK